MELLKRIRRLANAAPLSVEELERQAGDWTEILIDKVPLEWLPDLYKRAAWNHPNSHMVNAYDLISEYKSKLNEIEVEKERVAEIGTKRNPLERCSHKDKHENAAGDVFAYNFYSEKDELMPCPHCRPDDLTAWKKSQIAFYGEIKSSPIKPAEAVQKILCEKEVYLTLIEAKKIADEYNGLVEKILESDSANQHFVKFDEGANRFKYPHRADVLFTADDIQKKIADYKKILDGREQSQSS